MRNTKFIHFTYSPFYFLFSLFGVVQSTYPEKSTETGEVSVSDILDEAFVDHCPVA